MLTKKEELSNMLVVATPSASHIGMSTLRMEPQFMIVGHSAWLVLPPFFFCSFSFLPSLDVFESRECWSTAHLHAWMVTPLQTHPSTRPVLPARGVLPMHRAVCGHADASHPGLTSLMTSLLKRPEPRPVWRSSRPSKHKGRSTCTALTWTICMQCCLVTGRSLTAEAVPVQALPAQHQSTIASKTGASQ